MNPDARTLQNIADRAGVSRMSVCRALGNKPGVSEKLKAQILQIAEEMGYRKNPLISSLMTSLRVQRARPSSETGTVLAFIERADQQRDVRDEHFAGASRAAEAQGYHLEPFITGKAGLPPSRLDQVLRARNIHGLIIAPLPEAHGHFAMDWNRFCSVAIEYTFVEPAFDRVVHDTYSSMRLILSKCRARRLRRVGLIFSANGRERTEGLYEAAYWLEQKSDSHFRAIPPLCLPSWDPRAVLHWLDRHEPEVVITSALFVRWAYRLIEESGRTIPDNTKIITVNRFPGQDSGIDQRHALIGANAAMLLIDKMNRNDRGIPQAPNTLLTPGAWVDGTSF